ncbi:MAG: mechanosensitive ion channel, partial [Flavobacteriaceae bacterium]|nr:mechanosensitive ion channel [Flavobacteriaceae bacterium]
MDRLKHLIYDYLIESGTAISTAKILNMLVLFLLAALTIYIIETIIRKIILIISAQIASKTNTDFDDILIANKLPRNISHIVPLMLIGKFTPIVFTDFRTVFDEVTILVQAAAVILTLWIVRSLLNSIKDYLKTIPNFKDKPIDSYIQVFMIFAWVVGLILVFAIVTGIPIQRFLVGMGTASAVILLIFKDTILGFVASIQVSINDMVRIGDWITFVKYGADGDVVEINLATVKVQNFDKTITTIPTYALISDSFKNWRGMSDSGGRRIKRALSIKLSSVKYLSINDVNELKKIDLITS